MPTLLKRLALALLALLLLLVAVGWWLLRGSLPRLDGDVVLPGLAAPVLIQRDRLGVVTVEAAREADAMRALGYVHAQERYFEMDLMRRSAAGELAALFGEAALDVDRRHRVHRLRARARRDLARIVDGQGAGMAAYVDGVNAGLAALPVRPWPYLLLRQAPRPWTLEDSALVGDAMYFDLQDPDNARELALWKLRPHLPAALYGLLVRDGSRWDAPMAGSARGDASLPDASEVDLRRLPAHPGRVTVTVPRPVEVGSNSFAVAAALTADGRAILANDMHLTLRAPNIWFRARLRYADARADGGRVDVSGFTLPGLPVVVAGSNGHVAWGFTNSYSDQADWAVLPACVRACADETVHVERLAVAGAPAVDLPVHDTAWGPVLHTLPDGRRLALRWSAQLPGALRLSFAGMARATGVASAFAVADRAAIPAQNVIVADRGGHVGWRVFGPLPQRAPGCDAPGVSPAAACAPWPLASDRSPRIVDPPAHRLWTANNRIVDGTALRAIGDGGFVLGARARQIRDDLHARPRFAERDLLAIQLDDRALFLQPWWRLLQDAAARGGTPALRGLAAEARDWSGRASVDSVGFGRVRAWRLAVHDRIARGLTAPAQAAMGRDFAMPALPQFEGTVWPLVAQRPPHLLPAAYPSWDALFEDAAREVRADARRRGGPDPWGRRNTARICHPLARALPGFAAPLLCMPADPLPGDTAMPRVQAPDMGASERMVVAPGHEADGIIHMPGGQSGHPLSPYWGAGHQDWVHGRATPFLPGKAEHSLRLRPP